MNTELWNHHTHIELIRVSLVALEKQSKLLGCNIFNAEIMKWTNSIAVGALVYCAKEPQFQTHFKLRVGHLLIVHPAANRDLVETLGR